MLAGQDYDLFFDLNGSAAERLDLRLLNGNRVALQVKNGKQTLLAENQATESRISVSLRALKKFSLGGKKSGPPGIGIKGRSRHRFFLAGIPLMIPEYGIIAVMKKCNSR